MLKSQLACSALLNVVKSSTTLGFIAVTLCLSACGSRLQPPAEIRVGLLAPLSGEQGEITGKPTVQGAKLAVKEVNEAGGLKIGDRQYQVTLLVEDDKDIPDEAVTAARKLIYQENVVALVGFPLSRIAIPVGEFAESSRTPAISSISTNPQTTAGKKYVFRAAFIDDFQGKVMAHFVAKDLKAKRAALLYDVASPYNQGIAKVFKEVFEQEGGQIVKSETYTTDANQNFRQQLERIRDSRPEVLFLPNYKPDLKLQASQIKQLQIKTILIGGDSWDG